MRKIKKIRGPKVKLWSFIDLTIDNNKPGYTDAVVLPKNPDAWVKSMKDSLDEAGYISMHVDTLAGGSGGCGFTFSPESYPGSAFQNENPGEVFSFVLSKEEMLALQRAINFAVGETV